MDKNLRELIDSVLPEMTPEELGKFLKQVIEISDEEVRKTAEKDPIRNIPVS